MNRTDARQTLHVILTPVATLLLTADEWQKACARINAKEAEPFDGMGVLVAAHTYNPFLNAEGKVVHLLTLVSTLPSE